MMSLVLVVIVVLVLNLQFVILVKTLFVAGDRGVTVCGSVVGDGAVCDGVGASDIVYVYGIADGVCAGCDGHSVGGIVVVSFMLV